MTTDEADDFDPMIGRVIESYVVTRRLGLGGMGAVYEARHTVLNHRRAIKMLLPEVARGELAQRFIGEAKAAAAIDHPGIVRVDNIGNLEDGRSFIVMELLRGHDCDELAKAGPQPLELVLSIAVQACSALHAAHEIGIVHRDLKPANLWLSPSGRIKVLDFGIAKLSPALAASVRTSSQMVAGTIGYMAPEQGRGLARVDRRADVFSLGVVLFRLLTGKMPWESVSIGDHVYLVTRTDVPTPDPAHARADLPRGWSEVIRACLAADPGQRPPTARALADLLVDAAAPWSTAVVARFAGELADQSEGFPRVMQTVWLGDSPPTIGGTIFAVASGGARSTPPRRRVMIAVGALAVIGLIAAAILVMAARSRGAPRGTVAAGGLSLDAALAALDADRPGADAGLLDPPADAAGETPADAAPVEAPADASALLAPVDAGSGDAPAVEAPADAGAARPTPLRIRPPIVRDTRPGRLMVVSRKWALVWVDGVAQGQTPVDIEVPVGTHRVVIEGVTGVRETKKIKVEAGATTTVMDTTIKQVPE